MNIALHRPLSCLVAATLIWGIGANSSRAATADAEDYVRELQRQAVAAGTAEWGHWGASPEKFSDWTSHSNRLVPVYTFGIDLSAARARQSYLSEERLQEIYGQLPERTLNPAAEYLDQTDIYWLQVEAFRQGKKHIVLIVFDGMDWETTQAAAIHQAQQVGYDSGRGNGLWFQDYRGTNTDFGFFVSSPHNTGTDIDVDAQTVVNPGGEKTGGYNAELGGATPWERPSNPKYLLGEYRQLPHVVTDSASSATSMTAGIKTFNSAINVDPEGKQVDTVAHRLQEKRGFAIGVVTSVPVSHATPACAYAHNVTRNDYQDLTKDLLGYPSVAHRGQALPGVDVLLGCGWGEEKEAEERQGVNFMPGNRFLPDDVLEAVDIRNGGPYTVVQRTAGKSGRWLLARAADQAVRSESRLFGFFGAVGGHLPYATADGGYNPTRSANAPEVYSEADLYENPTLEDMTRAALRVLETDEQGFWLLIEAGDVDWANHDNNLDNSIGAVICGDDAFRAVTEWAERNNRWEDTAVILTADHGHFLVLEQPQALVEPAVQATAAADSE